MTFTQEMLRAGRVPSSRMLTRAIRPSSTAEAESLGIAPGEPIVHLVRLRQADGEPIALESTVLIEACAPRCHGRGPRPAARCMKHSRGPGSCPRRGTGTIAAAAAGAEEARLLQIRTGDPLLVERRVILDHHGRRIEATESIYAADRYALDVKFDVEARDLGRTPGGA